MADQASGDRFAGAGRRSLRSRLTGADGVLALASAVLLPLGLMVIILGWYGAAHTPYGFEQTPYLISGGLGGLGVMLAGGLLYFGSWIARSSVSQRAANEELIAILADIRHELAGREESASPAPRTRKGTGNSSGHSNLVATATGSMLHRPDCTVVVGRQGLKAASAGSGLRPCGLCDPLSTGSSVPA